MLELVSQVSEKTFRETVEGWGLTYVLKSSGAIINSLSASGFKQNTENPSNPGMNPQGYVSFTYTPTNEYPSITGNSGVLPETLQTHVKDTFDMIKAKVAAGEPIVEPVTPAE